MRGSLIEGLVLDKLKQLKWTHSIYYFGMVSSRGKDWLACSQDSFTLLNYPADFASTFACENTAQCVWEGIKFPSLASS